MALRLASILVYPVKSLGGIALPQSRLTDRGLEHDRRWMVVDEQGTFLSQREVPAMACIHTEAHGEGFRVTDRRDGSSLELPWSMPEGQRHRVSVWSQRITALHGKALWDEWFSDRLRCSARLVYMPDTTRRPTDGRYAKGLTSLSDGFPHLIVSQASLDDLNARGQAWAKEHMTPWAHVPMDRFRPNLVVAGGTAFQEDGWTDLRIGGATFRLVKPCARCVVVTTDQRTGERGKEPLRTLATYRSRGNKVMFGMNAVGDAEGIVRVGDLVTPTTA